jgi:hypothetical protein
MLRYVLRFLLFLPPGQFTGLRRSALNRELHVAKIVRQDGTRRRDTCIYVA